MDGGLDNGFLVGGDVEDTFIFSAFSGEGMDTISDFNPAVNTLSLADLLDSGAAGLDDDLSAFAATIDVNVSTDGNDLILTIHDQGAGNSDTTVTLAGLGHDYAAFDGGHLSDIIDSVSPDPTIHVDTCAS